MEQTCMETCWIGFKITGIQVCPRNSLEDLFHKCLFGRFWEENQSWDPQNGWLLTTMIPAFMEQPNNQRTSMKIRLKFRKGWASQIFPSNPHCDAFRWILLAIPGSSKCVKFVRPSILDSSFVSSWEPLAAALPTLRCIMWRNLLAILATLRLGLASFFFRSPMRDSRGFHWLVYLSRWTVDFWWDQCR